MLVIENADGTQSSYEVRRFLYAGALSQCYTLTLDAVDPTNRLAGQTLLFRPASLQYVGSSGDNETISGLITAVTQQKDPIKQTTFYQIQIEPYLSLLALQREFKAYNNESYLAISQGLVRNLNLSQGLSNYADFQITMPWITSPLQTHDIACEDSDLDYFNKILGFAHYYFDQSANPEKLVVIDRPGLLPTREQTLLFDPTRKEDLKNNTPAFYYLSLKKEAQNLSAQPFYFDPKNPEESLKTLQNSNPLLYETRIYAPLNWYDFLKMKLTEQMSSATEVYTFKGYYSHLNVGERIMLQSALGNGAFEAFVESLQIEGHYQDDVWRFDVEGVLRPYAPTGIWLGPMNPRKPIPTVLTGGILQEANHVNDLGEYQVKLPLGFNVSDVSPIISVREIQETVTSDGGASHSVSGTSDTVLISQDGLPSDLLLTGSLIDNKRTSHISSESYREAGVQMKGGLKMHMRRSDGNNSYSELGSSLKDSQGNTAHLTMGANSQTLSEQGDRAHGIITQSTGYAKRVVSGNDYDTVGDPNNPVTQKSLVNQNGQTVHSTQTNVGSGVYQQTYYTQAAGVKVNNAASQANANAQLLPNLTQEEKLFFATVYGEAVGQGQNAWMAIASVIMNRVNKYDWQGKCPTVTAVIEYHAAFSSYYDPALKGPSAEFSTVMNYLNNPTGQPPEDLYDLVQTVYPIYAKIIEPTTIALFYYSPEHQAEPKYIADDLAKKSIVQINVDGVSEEDFLFYTYTWLYNESEKK